MKKTLLIVAGIMMMSACMSQEIEPNEPEPELELELEREPEDEKPVLYFYPKETTEIEVKLDYQGEFTFTYPEYNNGWNMIAHPDGTLVDPKTNRSYNYLFWEGQLKRESIDEGFVVKGSEVVPFLEEKLSTLGLNSKEQADFITYWGPRLQKNPYNIVKFLEEEYEQTAPLTISPEPDSIQRIFMVFTGAEKPIELPEQILEPFERDGFAVIEWGGQEL